MRIHSRIPQPCEGLHSKRGKLRGKISSSLFVWGILEKRVFIVEQSEAFLQIVDLQWFMGPRFASRNAGGL